MLSIGEMVDKLAIELIKAHSLREGMHTLALDTEEYVAANEKLQIANENRGIIKAHLDKKIEDVRDGETNRILKHMRTY